MRLVKVTCPRGQGTNVAKIAFDAGITDASVQQLEQHKAGGGPVAKESVDVHVSTPEARSFIEGVVKAPFYNRNDFSIEVREPRAVLKSTSVREITRPISAPMVDIDQELWQFSYVTFSFGARVLIAALLMAYGMIQNNALFMAGGLMFLPLTPLVLGISFGTLTRQWTLVAQGLGAFVTATALIAAAGAAVAAVADPPMMFDQFPPMIAGVFFSVAIGIAAALATADDAGHRQLIGLAAASQLALVPAWFGISLIYGFSDDPGEKLMAFGANALALIIGSGAVYAFLTRGRIAEGGAAATRGE